MKDQAPRQRFLDDNKVEVSLAIGVALLLAALVLLISLLYDLKAFEPVGPNWHAVHIDRVPVNGTN